MHGTHAIKKRGVAAAITVASVMAVAIPTSALAATTPVPPTVTASPAPSAPANACASAPKAPWRLNAVRDASDPTTVAITWAAVPCAAHYNVSIWVDGTDSVQIVDGGSSSGYTASGIDPSRNYQIQVSSRDGAGNGASTPVFYLRKSIPHGVRGMTVQYTDVTSAALNWQAPTDRLPNGYLLKVTRLKDQTVVMDQQIPADATTFPLTGMDARGMYVITLQALNAAGKGPISRLVLGDERPNPVSSVGAIRDPGNPDNVIVTWLPSDNTLRGNVIGYEVGFGAKTATDRVMVKVTDATVSIPYTKSGVIQVRVITDRGKSGWSKVVHVLVDGNPDLTTTNPNIDLVEQQGTISIAATQNVASSYRLMVKILPTANNGNFADTQYSQNGSNVMTFRKVPDGSYVVTVNGGGQELARKYINVGNVGTMFAPDWTITEGKANLTADVVDMYYGAESRVFSTKTFPSQDAVLSTTAHLKSGLGYGIWLRASGVDTNLPSGLTFQYDNGWGQKFILRQWQDGKECSPMAFTSFPANMSINSPHDIVVSVQGDTLYATIDGVRLFDVSSLTASMASSGCGFAAPTGTAVGFRTWGGGTAATFTGTTIR